ncbi:apolipoprotein N-acyltransferase [Rhodomicrobium sp. Az07]|uniref:apolipoprotein N-acyltransferase n=1 Tax=Rhodomicrobium sp. Az07 TaxID=2839034 RepID=UPI001BEB4527|nr:apolipoprotein N-acyltransferase [Rhodomicrobium sp. Az07]MBT3069604.1 apolipoprotein N-acyltransferase [Rhodomicrobium sp. Az07]
MDSLPTAVAGLKTWKLVLIAFLAGALSVLAMAPFHIWPVLFLTFPLMIWTLDAVAIRDDATTRLDAYVKRLKSAALLGWAFGFGYFLAGIYWIGFAFYVDAQRYAILMPFAVIGLCAALGLFYAVAAVLAAAMWRRGYARIVGFVFAFFCAEAARGYFFTGFPWNLFGQALAADEAPMQMAAYIGIYGLTLAALFIFSAPAAFIAAPDARFRRLSAPVLVAALTLAAFYAVGAQRLEQTVGDVPGVRIRIVQPNIPQQEKWKPENRRWIFDRALQLSRSGTSGEEISAFTHVIWPESSVPVLFAFNDRIYSDEVRDALSALIPDGTALIIGAERAEGSLDADGRARFDRAFNSLFLLGKGAEIRAVYDKIHLVPFGEYVPLGEVLMKAGFSAFSHRLDGFEAGAGPAVPIESPRAAPFLPLICYEIIFPGRTGSLPKRPEWLVNVTNDAWFGQSTGPYQHLHLARIRAVEEGLPVARAANTGISAIIDPFGRILNKIDLGKAGTIDHSLPRALPITFHQKLRMPSFIALFFFTLQFYLAMVALAKVG